MRFRRLVRWGWWAAALCLAAAGCSGRSQARPGSQPAATGRAVVYVAVGASESVGVGSSDPLRDAWTQRFYRDALPATAVFVNVAVSGATTAQALLDQLPTALSLDPTVVTVWLNVNDLLHQVAVAVYQQELASVVSQLRRGGQATVLVADTPPLDQLPAYRSCLAGTAVASRDFSCPAVVPPPAVLDAEVDAYNTATAQVVAANGAVLVDLPAAGLAAEAGGTEASLVGGDGFHPSDAGHALVARTFAAAYQAAVTPHPAASPGG